MLEQVVKTTYNRVVLTNGIFGLRNITDVHEYHGENRYADDKDQQEWEKLHGCDDETTEGSRVMEL